MNAAGASLPGRLSGGGQTETGDDPRAALQKDRLKSITRPNRRVFLAPKETAPARGKLGPQLQVGVPEGYRHNSDVVSKFADPIKFCFSVCVQLAASRHLAGLPSLVRCTPFSL